MKRLTAAESLLKELGVTEPSELDLDAIAWHVGARIKYRELDGCEARILGVEQRAIISVDQRQNYQRQRFSIGHELGHWEHHRGRALICQSEDIGNPRLTTSSSEYVANTYAADLLMPWYLIQPIIRSYSKLNVKLIDDVRELFDTSRSATAIRVIDSNEFSAILVCHNQNGRRWFKRTRGVPEKWFPQNNLDSDSIFLMTTGGLTLIPRHSGSPQMRQCVNHVSGIICMLSVRKHNTLQIVRSRKFIVPDSTDHCSKDGLVRSG